MADFEKRSLPEKMTRFVKSRYILGAREGGPWSTAEYYLLNDSNFSSGEYYEVNVQCVLSAEEVAVSRR